MCNKELVKKAQDLAKYLNTKTLSGRLFKEEYGEKIYFKALSNFGSWGKFMTCCGLKKASPKDNIFRTFSSNKKLTMKKLTPEQMKIKKEFLSDSFIKERQIKL